MKRFVFLKIGQGDFEKGFSLTLKIISPDLSPFPEVEIDCEFPSNPQIKEIYQQCLDSLQKLSFKNLIEKEKVQEYCREYSQKFYNSSKQLKSNIKNWLSSSTNTKFQRLRETLSSRLDDSDDIFIFLQTDNEILKKLPWQEWDLLSDRFTKSELVLSPPEINFVLKERTQRKYKKIRILSILGDRTGIDLKEDRKIIENLPYATAKILVEPDRQQFSNELWDKDWDILFFAGHSKSKRESGVINLNPNDRLPIAELKNSLRKVADRGLQLAIFNSCDGLKLAEYLAELKIPQIIVMREPIPDTVAQLFLKYFLQVYSRGESLYFAVRQARSRLEAIEKETPGATWIPIIYQNFIQEPLIWPKDWRCDRTLTEHSDHVTAVAIHPDGKTFATGSLDKKIILWDLETGEVKTTCEGTSSVIFSLDFSPDGKILASSSNLEFQDGTIKLWDSDTLKFRNNLSSNLLALRVSCIAFSPDGLYLASGNIDATIKIWNLSTGKTLHTLRGHGWDVRAVSFSRDGQLLVSGGLDGAIKIWNWHNARLLNTLIRPSPEYPWDFSALASWFDSSVGSIWSIAISPDKKLLVSGDSDGSIKMWDIHNIKNARLIKVLTEHSKTIYALAFSPDGKTLASGSKDETIRIWDSETGKLLQTLTGHSGAVRDIAFSPNGQILISVSEDTNIKIWCLS
ncbi:MAG: PD40 domain-containing protein [Cyanobacteria bacterium SBLK]|nr:PD40 domain-containing protein [Cyanobacteria bacterium SBLK]